MSEANNKMVSIVLPVYNGETNVGHAIESILQQTYSNLELIIVNDCSTDGTAGILEQYAVQDKRIQIINNPVNLKLPQTLNKGFERTHGEYCTWTSDDNLYKKNAIQRMVEVLEANPDIDMVYADYTTIDKDGHNLNSVRTGAPAQLLTTNPIGACFMYTRQIMQKAGGYDPNLFLAEDYDYWIRLWRIGQLKHMDENLYYYRCHPGSLTETKKELIGMQTFKVLEKNFLFLYSAAKTKRKKHAFIDQMFLRMGNHNKEELWQLVTEIDKTYACHARILQARKWLSSTVIGKLLRKMKGRVQ